MLAPSHSLFWKLFIPVGVLLFLSALSAAIFLPIVIQRNAEQEAISAGQDTVKQYKALRKYYTENVITKILNNGVLSVSSEHLNNPKAVPLPATMIHELSALLQNSGTALKLYSPYPFPNRKDRVMDKFGEDAWSFFQNNPNQTFFRTEALGDKTIVRVAIADRMVDQACVNCHNSVIGSPKTDWKLNDVRGVLEVDSSKQLDSGHRIVTQVLSALALLLLLIAIFLRIFYQRNIARPLNIALDAARILTEGSEEKLLSLEAIASGNLDQDIVLTNAPKIDKENVSDDEVGVLLKSVIHMSEVQVALDQAFRKMAISLREGRSIEAASDWLKTSQNDLNALMRGEHQTAELADKILCYLVNRVGAAVAALYLYDERSKELQLVASYALIRRKNLSDHFALGEGLIGQAAHERKTICLENVPPDYLTITSALGEATPRNIVAVPLLQGEHLVGAMEIGAFKTFTDAELELLETTSEGIAIGFGVNLSRNQTQELLAQSQSQSEELRVQQEELQQSNEELSERAEILERQREQIRIKNDEVETISREIQRKADQLEKASTYKSEFLANMSHELRTPLNSMLILSGLLKENKDVNLNPKQVEYASTINAAGKDLLHLINDILDLSKVEAGEIDLHYEEVRLQDIYLPMETMFRPLAEEKGLSFILDVANGPQEMNVDLARTQQVLKNLLSNAIKFTMQGSVTLQIRFASESENPLSNAAVAFSVEDSGIGIPADKQSLVFEAFKQADGGINRKYGGTGLGLSISRQLAYKMNGDVTLSSVEDKGSVFTLYLPLKPSSEQTHRQHIVVQKLVTTQSEKMKNASSPDVVTAFPKPDLDDDRANIKPGDKCILIIEDDTKFAKILMNFVREKNFAALVANDGESGISLCTHFLPSAIILDVTLPKMDGWGVMQSLKDNPATRHIPVHFITGVENRKTAMEMGAVGFITKPISMEQLSEVFNTIENSLAKTVKKLLIVEDNPIEVKSLIELLSEKNILIQTAATGQQAIQLLSTERFDCIVLDLGLSDMSGFDLLNHMQSMEGVRQIPVIIHSGRDLNREDERELRRFAESIIIKGAKSPERLLNEVSLFLHLVESKLPSDKQRMIRASLNQESVLEGKKVLLVDDDMRNIFSLTALLTARGIVVLEAENGIEALRQLAANPDVQLVLMDIMMPEMDGYTAMREIRKDPLFHQLPIIAMTAKAMKGDHQKCLDAGASDYIAKPIDTEKLMSLLRVWASRRT